MISNAFETDYFKNKNKKSFVNPSKNFNSPAYPPEYIIDFAIFPFCENKRTNSVLRKLLVL